MDSIKLYARAKINISLDVLNKNKDGYHNIKTVMQTTKLKDIVFLKKIENNEIKLKSNISWLPTDERNLVYKTASIIKDNYNIKSGIKIILYKKIPICAGLGGGSSDCAATIIGLKNLFNLPMSKAEVYKLGKSLGADVPFCINRGTALAEGIGDILTNLNPFPNCFILISKPSINISTKNIFSNLNVKNIKGRKDIEKLIYYIKTGNILEICNNMFNVLEEVVIPSYPYINKVKQVMLKNNAIGCLMSGSGSAVFGIWLSKSDAINALKELKYKYNIKETFLTVPFNNYKFK